MSGWSLYWRYAATSIRMQMQYPGSFLMLIFVQFAAPFVVLAGIWALFDRFDRIAGWGIAEVAMFFGMTNVSFALADSINRGFDLFGPLYVRTGDFDRILLRPRATALQVVGYELRIAPMGRLLQGLIVFGVALSMAMPSVGLLDVAVLLAAILGGAALFSGLLILQATLAFWTVDGLEVANTLTYGGVEASRYPLDIYQRWFSTLLIAIVPFGCVTYFPILHLLRRSDPLGAPDWFLPVAPLVGFVFLGIALGVWGFGVRHYRSSGT